MNYSRFLPVGIAASFVLLWSCQPGGKNNTSFIAPLVDGRCEEYQDVAPIELSEDVNLYIIQNSNYVWISYCYPEGSYGTVDITLESPELKEPLNLHVSAQVGEWPANKPDLAPKNPESDIWWNHKGWTANPVWINGMEKTEDGSSYRFKNGLAREIQLSKERFGKGEWKISMNIRSIMGRDGQRYSIDFPEDQSSHTILVD